MITDNDKHNTANKSKSLTLLSGLFISIVVFFFLILSKILTIDRNELNAVANRDYTTSRRLITPGSIYITSYDGPVASLISGFTSSKWNHIALVGEENKVHEILGVNIKTTNLSDWRNKWAGKTIVLLERKSQPTYDINKRVLEVKQHGIKISTNPVFLAGLLFNVDLDEETMYCTKFARCILNEDIPLVPGEYVSRNDSLLQELYYQSYPIRYIQTDV